MKLRLNKKGDEDISQKSMFFLFAVMVIAAMIIWIYITLTSLRDAPIFVSDDEYISIYTERFLSSPDCFAYTDVGTGNVYSGIIDLNKFNKKQLNSCYVPNEKSKYEFFLTLQYEGQEINIATENYKTISKQIPNYVLVVNGNQISKGRLLVGADYDE